jgi:hypothetical protein
VIDPAGESFEIDVHYTATTFLDVQLRTTYRAMRSASGSKTLAVLGETGIEYGLQDLEQALLDQTVRHGGHA